MFPRDLTVWKLTCPNYWFFCYGYPNPAFWTMLCWLVQSPRFSGQFPGVLRRTHHSNVENTWKYNKLTIQAISYQLIFFRGAWCTMFFFLRMLLAILLLKAMNFVPAMLVHHKHFLLKVKLPKWPVVNTKVILRHFRKSGWNVIKFTQIFPGLDCAVEDFSNILREQDTNSSTVERYVKIFLWVEEFLCWAIFFSAHVNRSLNWESLNPFVFCPKSLWFWINTGFWKKHTCF